MADDTWACAYSSGLTRHDHGTRRTKRFGSALACDAAYLVVKGRILNLKLNAPYNDFTNSDLKNIYIS